MKIGKSPTKQIGRPRFLNKRGQISISLVFGTHLEKNYSHGAPVIVGQKAGTLMLYVRPLGKPGQRSHPTKCAANASNWGRAKGKSNNNPKYNEPILESGVVVINKPAAKHTSQSNVKREQQRIEFLLHNTNLLLIYYILVTKKNTKQKHKVSPRSSGRRSRKSRQNKTKTHLNGQTTLSNTTNLHNTKTEHVKIAPATSFATWRIRATYSNQHKLINVRHSFSAHLG
jgi:hypothetical protein